MIFEMDSERRGDWDHFQIRKIGFKAQRGLSAEEQAGYLHRFLKPKRVVKKLSILS